MRESGGKANRRKRITHFIHDKDLYKWEHEQHSTHGQANIKRWLIVRGLQNSIKCPHNYHLSYGTHPVLQTSLRSFLIALTLNFLPALRDASEERTDGRSNFEFVTERTKVLLLLAPPTCFISFFSRSVRPRSDRKVKSLRRQRAKM